jgi:adenylosuccinate lyase
MIPRYTRPEMGAVWSDQRRYGAWLEVELAATDALADAGVVPRDDARVLRERAAFDIARIEEIEQTTQHDVIAFTTGRRPAGCISGSPRRMCSTRRWRCRCARPAT